MRKTTQKELLRRFVVRTVVILVAWVLIFSLLIQGWWTDVARGDIRPIFLIIGIPLGVAWAIYLLEDSTLRAKELP